MDNKVILKQMQLFVSCLIKKMYSEQV